MAGEPTTPEIKTSPTPELKPTREQTLDSFSKSLSLMEGAGDLSPEEQVQLKTIKEVAERTIDKGHDYEVVTFKNKDGGKFITHESIQMNGLLSFLDRKIESGSLSPEEQAEYEDHRETLRARTREYSRGKRLDPTQKVARIVQEAKLAKGNDETVTYDEYFAAARRLEGRLELVMPRKLSKSIEDEILASGVSIDEATFAAGLPPAPAGDDAETTVPSGAVPAPSRHRPPEPAIDTPAAEVPPKSAEPKTVEELHQEITITNRAVDVEKRARKTAEEHLHSILRGEGGGGRVRRLFRRIRYRVGEEYYKQRFTEQARHAMLESGNPYLEMGLVGNALQVVNAERGRVEADEAARATIERLGMEHGAIRTPTEQLQEVEGPLRDELIATIVRPIFDGRFTTQQQVQEQLRQFVEGHQDDPAVQEFFGRDTTQMGRLADFFATDLMEMGQTMRADFDANHIAHELLDQAVTLRFGRAEWAAEQGTSATNADMSRTDRFIRWSQRRRSTGIIFNPVTVGALSSLGTFAILRAPGRALSVAGHIATPGVGMFSGGMLAALRRNYDLKVDRAAHNIEMTYGGQIGPDSRRREALEQYRYASISVNTLLNGGRDERSGTDWRSMSELSSSDLSVDGNRREVLRRIAEIEERLDFSARENVDLITFSSEFTVEQERLALVQAVAGARIRLREAGMSEPDMQRMRDDLIAEAVRPHFSQDRAQQDREFRSYRIRQSVRAGAFGAVAGLGVGFVSHEALTEVMHATGTGGGSYTGELLGGHRKVINPDSLREIYGSNKQIIIDNDLQLNFNANHTGEIVNLKTGQTLSAELKIDPTGHIHVKGELPPGVQERLNDGGFDIDKGPSVDGVKTIHENGSVVDSTIGHQTKIPEGTEWMQNPADPGKWNLVETGHPKNILVHDAQFDQTGKLVGYDIAGSKAQVELSEIVTKKEFVSGETAAADLDKYTTHVNHQEWYGYNTPYSERNELTAYNSIFTSANGQKGVVWDMSHMQLGYQDHLNPNPIDVQQVIHDGQSSWAFSVPGHGKVFVHDMSDGVLDGKINLDPSDYTHHINPSDPNSLTVGEFSQKILNQNALQQAVDGNIAAGRDPSYLASELTHRENVFNLGLNGKMGYIEAGRLNPDGTFQTFATARGSTDVQFEVVKEVQTTFNLTKEVAIKIPTYELTAADNEIFPIIPFPFAPRSPLERLLLPHHPGPEYGYGGEYSEGGFGLLNRSQYAGRKSPRLSKNKDANLDDKEEIQWYLDQQPKDYIAELEQMDAESTAPMSNKTRLVITIPAKGEERNIKKTLELLRSQTDRSGNPIDPELFEIVILENHPHGSARDLTQQEVDAFIADNPGIRVTFAHKEWSTDEQATIGNARKYVTDLALLRALKRTAPTGELIVASFDADVDGVSSEYVFEMINAFDANASLDAVAGKYTLPDEALDKPNLRAAQRLWYIFDRVISKDAVGPPSGRTPKVPGLVGRNAAFRAANLAAIGGYNPTTRLAEDLEIGWMIEASREYDQSRISYINRAEVVSNPRRFLAATVQGTPLINMYGDFHENDEVRKRDNAELLAKIPDTFDVVTFEREADALYNAGQYADNIENAKLQELFTRAMGFMGVEFKIVGGHVKITNADKLRKALEDESVVPPTPTPPATPSTPTPIPSPSKPTPPKKVSSPGSATSSAESAVSSEVMSEAELVRVGDQRLGNLWTKDGDTFDFEMAFGPGAAYLGGDQYTSVFFKTESGNIYHIDKFGRMVNMVDSKAQNSINRFPLPGNVFERGKLVVGEPFDFEMGRTTRITEIIALNDRLYMPDYLQDLTGGKTSEIPNEFNDTLSHLVKKKKHTEAIADLKEGDKVTIGGVEYEIELLAGPDKKRRFKFNPTGAKSTS